jgi:hypothetical protein
MSHVVQCIDLLCGKQAAEAPLLVISTDSVAAASLHSLPIPLPGAQQCTITPSDGPAMSIMSAVQLQT